MNFKVDGKAVFAYTAAHDLDLKKPTMVFIHGAGLDHSMFGLQSRYFGYHGWNVLALDLPGHGRSEGPPVPSIEGMADWFFRVMETLKISKTSVVGHSMGALVSLEAAARKPECVESIALIGTAFPMKVGEVFLEAARKNDITAFDMATIWGHAAQVPLGGNPNPGMWMYGDTLARLARLAPGVLYTDLKACNDYAGGLESASKVGCPALLVLGARDVMTPTRNAEALSKALKNVTRKIIQPSGHTLMAETPDATLEALIEFFAR
jgi:pimeloyl-ACP methyl ester carboxylesterase